MYSYTQKIVFGVEIQDKQKDFSYETGRLSPS